MTNLATLSVAAFLALAPAAFAQGSQVPNPADPAPANPRATNGEPTQAPARGVMGSGRSMSRDSGMGVDSGSGNPAHANGGNGPGGRY